MKRIVLLLLLLTATLPYAAARGEDADAIRSELLSFSGKVVSVSCDFIQRRESALLADAGTVTIRRDGREEPLSGL